MEITSPELKRSKGCLGSRDTNFYVCLKPLDALFKIPKGKSYWIVANSVKPKDERYARAEVYFDGCWRWNINCLDMNYYAENFYSAVSEILDKHFPNGGTHTLYFWILYR